METSAWAGSFGIGAGCLGFSAQRTTFPAPSTASTPNCEASASGRGRAATVTSAPVSSWKASIWRMSMR